mmetsp:Transcript_10141/g.12654  ORF Transcript_10141/g.12654 Transcript_10141/m.12654 type:complete len:115 (+) Transcript_10141:430-774(+)
MDFLRRLYAGHQRLKHKIHNNRIPLSPMGQKFMGFVYFTIPLIGGYFIMQWTVNRSNAKWNINEKDGTYSIPKEIEDRLGKQNIEKYKDFGRTGIDAAANEKITMDKLVYGKEV